MLEVFVKGLYLATWLGVTGALCVLLYQLCVARFGKIWMAKKFQDIEVGDQLVLPWHRCHLYQHYPNKYNPDAVYEFVVVVHRWHDPHERKDYVSLSRLRVDGTWDPHNPHRKYTLTGLAQAGYDWAQADHASIAKAVFDADNCEHISVLRHRKRIRHRRGNN